MTRRELWLGAVAAAVESGNMEKAARLIEGETRSGRVSAAVLAVRSRSGLFEKAFGRAASMDAVFLLASITKPMTVCGVMVLADRGEVALHHPVARYIPEFRGAGREGVLVRHLLTHTSGLPDMLPENVELRKRHASLAEFVAATCRTPLLFAPGTQVRYQSMGILLAAEIAARVAGESFPDFLYKQVFRPLRMRHTSLGLGGRPISATMLCQVEPASDWDWNSAYWRNLASPWGGAHSTARDVARFLDYFAHPGRSPLAPATARSMITLQTAGLGERWGLGWKLNDGKLAKGCSPAAFGHSGSTGTLCWCDPGDGRSFVLLTTRPAEHSAATLLYPVSDLATEKGV